MDTSAPQDASTKFYKSESPGFWRAGVIAFGIVLTGASLGAHSVKVTASLLVVTIAAGFLGYWILSKNYYFISATKVGIKDIFRTREVQFDDIRAVRKSTTRYSSNLFFECATGNVTLPIDVFNDAWLADLKAELHKRGIPLAVTAFGFPVKEE